MTDTELELPQGWITVLLPDVVKNEKSAIKRGPFGSHLKKEFFVKSGYKVYEQQHAINNDFTLGRYYINEEKFQELKNFQVKEDDIIISCSGTIGKIAVAPKNIEKGIINQALLKISLNEDIMPREFFKYLFKFWMNKSEIDSHGSGMGNLSSVKSLKKTPILLPPLNEQKRIISKIEELFSKIDSTKQSLDRIKLQLELYRVSLLKSAFEGKLTEGWREIKINELTKSRKIGLVRSIREQSTSGTPYLKMNNITIKGQLDLSSIVYVNCSDQELGNYLLEKNDILFNTRNSFELVGKTTIWDNSINNCIFNNNIMRIRTNNTILPKFLCYFMNSNMFKTKLLLVKKATTNICAIYDKDLKEQLVPFPIDIKQQKEIISRIEQGFSLIENTLQIVNSSLQKLQTMKMSVLKQAFEGKLVPQDPDDEPASVLLERIKSEKS